MSRISEKITSPACYISDFRFPIRARVSAEECSASHMNSKLMVGSSMKVGSKGPLTCQDMAIQLFKPLTGLVDFSESSFGSVTPPFLEQQSQKSAKSGGICLKMARPPLCTCLAYVCCTWGYTQEMYDFNLEMFSRLRPHKLK